MVALLGHLVAWVLLAAGAPATSPATASAVPAVPALAAGPGSRVSPVEFDRLIEQLGHPRFELREGATQQLCALDRDYLSELMRRYHAEARFEPKRRLRYAIETIFLRPVLVGRNGFMGIQVVQQVFGGLTDPDTGKTVNGIMIERALQGHPAQAAGVQSGDVIVGVDDALLPDDPTATTFIKMISGRPPGTSVKLRLLRPRKEMRRLDVVVGKEPRRSFEGASLQATQGGARVLDVLEKSPAVALGLKPGDVILAIEGREVAGAMGPATIDLALAGLAPGGTLHLGLQQNGAEDISVKLGSRPVELMQPADWAEARGRFLVWWQDMGGESSSRVGIGNTSGQVMLLRAFPQNPPVHETSIIP